MTPTQPQIVDALACAPLIPPRPELTKTYKIHIIEGLIEIDRCESCLRKFGRFQNFINYIQRGS